MCIKVYADTNKSDTRARLTEYVQYTAVGRNMPVSGTNERYTETNRINNPMTVVSMDHVGIKPVTRHVAFHSHL